MAFFRWVDRGSGSKVVCVFDQQVVFLGVVVVSDFGNGTCLFSRNRNKARQTMQVATQVTAESRQCVTDGDPARTTATTCIAQTRAMQVRIMRNLRRGVGACQACHVCARNNALFCRSGSPASVRVRFQRAGCSSFQNFEIPALLRFSMTGARTHHRRCCRHHRAPGHRSRRTIAAGRASGHTPHECGFGLAVVASAGCSVHVVVGKD